MLISQSLPANRPYFYFVQFVRIFCFIDVCFAPNFRTTTSSAGDAASPFIPFRTAQSRPIVFPPIYLYVHNVTAFITQCYQFRCLTYSFSLSSLLTLGIVITLF